MYKCRTETLLLPALPLNSSLNMFPLAFGGIFQYRMNQHVNLVFDKIHPYSTRSKRTPLGTLSIESTAWFDGNTLGCCTPPWAVRRRHFVYFCITRQEPHFLKQESVFQRWFLTLPWNYINQTTSSSCFYIWHQERADIFLNIHSPYLNLALLVCSIRHW